MPNANISSTRVACAVWVEHVSSSLQDGGWLLPFQGMSLLEHCISRLKSSTPWPVLLVGDESTPSEVREVAARHDVDIHLASSNGQMACLLEAANHLELERVLIAHGLLGLELFPDTLLKDLVGHHLDGGADVTMASDLPTPTFAVVCERRLISLLAELPKDPAVPEDPKAIFELLERLAPCDGLDAGIRIGREPLLGRCGASRTEIPHFIPWASPADVRRIAAATDSETIRSPLGRLRRLRELLIEDIESRHRKRLIGHRRQTKPVKVLFASSPSAYSGSEESLVNSLQALRGDEIEVHCLIAREGFFTERLRAAGALVHCPQRDFALPNVSNLLLLEEILDRVNPDLIHCNALVGSPLLAASRIRGIPLLQWVRFVTLDGFGEHLACADRITAVSKFAAGETSKQMVRKEKIRVLYDCVDCDRFSPAAIPGRDVRQEMGFSSEDFVVLCIARFVPYKRHDVLIKAMARLVSKHRRARLVLVGENERRALGTYDQCMAEILRLDLLSKTTLIGFQKDVRSLEAASDAVVLCSEQEPLGTVVLESMALGRPVVVANSGGLPEMVEDGVSGLHCISGSAESLCSQLCRLIEEPELGRTLGDNARRRAVERFSMKPHGQNLLAIYRELLAC